MSDHHTLWIPSGSRSITEHVGRVRCGFLDRKSLCSWLFTKVDHILELIELHIKVSCLLNLLLTYLIEAYNLLEVRDPPVRFEFEDQVE